MPSGSIIKKLRIQLLLDSKAYSKALGAATASFAKAGARFRSIGKSLSTSITLPIAAASVALLKFASDAEEQASKLNAVFGKQAQEVTRWAEAYGDAVNRGRESTKSFAADAGAVLGGLGFANEELARTSQLIVQIANDLSSFNNVSTEQAFGAVRGAITGEREALKSLGIVINEANVNQELLNLGLAGGTKNATAQQKAVATLNIIMRNASTALGDAAKTANGFANSSRGMLERFKDISTELGKRLLPIGLKVIGWINSLLGMFAAMSDRAQTTTLVVLGLTAALPPLIYSAGLLATGVAGLTAAFSALAAVAGTTMLPLIAGIAVATAGVVGVWLYWEEVSGFLSASFETVVGWLKTLAGWFVELKDKAIQAASDLVMKVVGKFAELQVKLTRIQDRLTIETDFLFGFDQDKLAEAMRRRRLTDDQLQREIIDSYQQTAGAVAGAVADRYDAATAAIGDLVNEAKGAAIVVGSVASFIGEGASRGIDMAIDDITERAKRKGGAVLEYFKSFLPDFANAVQLPTPGSGVLLPTSPLPLPAGEGGTGDPAAKQKSFNELVQAGIHNVEDFSRRAVSAFDDVSSGIVEAIRSGENFGDTMRRVASDLAADFAQMAIKNVLLSTVAGGMSALGGGSFSGGFASAFQKAFAGGFAEGGYIPGGKFGMVGENGIEFVSGPANITPISDAMMAPTINIINQAPGVQVVPQQNAAGQTEMLILSTVSKDMQRGRIRSQISNQFGAQPTTRLRG
jgi:hypothetical protein